GGRGGALDLVRRSLPPGPRTRPPARRGAVRTAPRRGSPACSPRGALLERRGARALRRARLPRVAPPRGLLSRRRGRAGAGGGALIYTRATVALSEPTRLLLEVHDWPCHKPGQFAMLGPDPERRHRD